MSTRLNTRAYPRWLVEGLSIGLGVALLAVSSKIVIHIPGTPVPITMQTLAVLLIGMTLGPVRGALTVLSYLGALAAGMPWDANSRAALALFGPTAGYLVGFVPGALVAGLAGRKLLPALAFGPLAILVIYLFGVIGLLPFTGGSWAAAVMAGAVPFIFVDFGKALLAAALVKLGGESWLRWVAPPSR